FPIRSWTLDWYTRIFSDAEVIQTFVYSVIIAVLSTLISVVVGTWIAVLLEGRKFWGRAFIFGMMVLPALVPGIISAIAFRIWAHAVHNVPFVSLVVMARLSTLPKSQIEAARDLGADPLIAFLRITLPYLVPAILGASVFCLLLSFDDFVRSFFLGGYEPTLPVLIFAMLRSGMSPEINAISTVALVLTAAIGIWAERFTRKAKKGLT
ncbi:MAG: ABC transporter permease, partial [bacterium]